MSNLLLYQGKSLSLSLPFSFFLSFSSSHSLHFLLSFVLTLSPPLATIFPPSPNVCLASEFFSFSFPLSSFPILFPRPYFAKFQTIDVRMVNFSFYLRNFWLKIKSTSFLQLVHVLAVKCVPFLQNYLLLQNWCTVLLAEINVTTRWCWYLDESTEIIIYSNPFMRIDISFKIKQIILLLLLLLLLEFCVICKSATVLSAAVNACQEQCNERNLVRKINIIISLKYGPN